MARLTDEPDEILHVGNRKVYVYVTELDGGQVAVDYEARPLVIERALDAPPPPRRRCVVGSDRDEALRLAHERFKMMWHMRKLSTVDPRRLAYH